MQVRPPTWSAPVLAALVLAACGPEAAVEPVGERFDLPPTGWQVDAVAGPIPLSVPVRAVNDWGVPVRAEDPEAAVTGSGGAITVHLDAYGHGAVVLDEAGTWEVSVEGVTAEGQATAATAELPPLHRAVPSLGPVQAVVAAQGGALVATPDEVWLAGTDGTWTSVLAPPGGGVRGLLAAHLDGDGVLDAVAWTAEAVVLLRGRPAGGLAWSAGLSAPGWEVAGVAVADTTGDRVPDVAVAWTRGAGGALEVWEADGPESWTPAPPVDLLATPMGIAAGDNTDDLHAQITVTGDDGGWARYVRSEGRYAATGPAPPQIELDLELGTEPRCEGDTNGDGGDELFLFGPRAIGTDRAFETWDLLGTQPAVYRSTASAAWADLEDDLGDGEVDLWTLDDGSHLSVQSWAEGAIVRRSLATLPESAPFALRDHDGDRIPELFLAGGEVWSWWPGVRDESGVVDLWAPAEGPGTAVAAAGEIAVVADDLDGDPGDVELATFSREGGAVTVDLWQVAVGPDPEPVFVTATQVSSGGTPRDLAACDGTVYALLDDGLHALSLSGSTLLLDASVSAGGDRLACGDGPDGAAVVVLDGSSLVLRDAELVETGTRTAPDGAADVAFAPEDGTPSVVTCDTPGCTVAPWAWGAGGEVAVARADEDGIAISTGVDFRGGGEVSTGDVDGDGHDDLLATADGWVAAWPSTGEGFGAGWWWHAEPAPVGPVQAIDLTGDLAADLAWLDASGDLVIVAR